MANATLSQDPMLQELVDRIVKAGDPDRVILFGSRARGDFRPGSDYDFLVIKDVPREIRREYRRGINRSLFGTAVSKDVIVATPEEIRRFGPLIGTVLKPALEEGIVVYERAA
jgi:predicted nucleotidyltransferase